MLIVTCYEQGAPSGAKYKDIVVVHFATNWALLAELNTTILRMPIVIIMSL